MSGEPQLFRIDPATRTSEAVSEVDFTAVGVSGTA